MVADLAVAGEGHADHEDQRQDGQDGDEEHRRGHQEAVEVGVEQLLDVLAQGVDVAAGGLVQLGGIAALEGAAPDPEHDAGQKDGGQAVEQNQDGTVALGVLKDLQLLVPVFLLFDAAQAGQHGQVVEAVGDHEHDVGHLGRQEQQALGHLLVGHIAQAHDDAGQLDHGVAVFQGLHAGDGIVGPQGAAHFQSACSIHP